MIEELDESAVVERAERILHELQSRRIRRALQQLGHVRDNLAMRQAYGLSYWFNPDRFPDLVGDLQLYFLSDRDMPSEN